MNVRLCLAASIWLVPAALLACGKDEDGPSEDDLEIVDLGSHDVHDTGGFTGALSVEIPDGASSVMAYCGGYGDAQLGKVWYVTQNGTQIYDADSPGGKFRAEFLDDMATTVVPLSKPTALTAGTWTFDFWIGANNPGTVDCEAVIRLTEPGDQADILVELVFVGLDGLDAASAETNPDFQAILEQFEAEWGSAGLNPVYTYKDFGGDVGKYSVVDVTDDNYKEFNDLLRTTSPDNARSVTFFLVEEISNSSPGGGTILGLSAGPPGAAAVPGTSKSGVIVSAVDWESAPSDVAKIMAHEGGHFLGLYHTTEIDGSEHDPIGDSPECPPSNDTDGNGTMNSAECTGKGAENVMWWTLTQGNATFSNDQGWVIRRSPAAD